jgi:hypothetical protein
MAVGGQPVERLRQYLRQLSPGARALLIAELERTLLRGDEVPGGDLVLQEVRQAVRESGASAPRIGNPARLFFYRVEPFLVDDSSALKHQGASRVPRSSRSGPGSAATSCRTKPRPTPRKSAARFSPAATPRPATG